MPITYTWAEVEPVHVEQYITAERNNEQNDILQSRDLFLSRRFDEYYKKVDIDNLFNSYTTNLDWKESVDTFDDILLKYPTQEQIDTIYTKLDTVVNTYEELLQLYPNNFDYIEWQEPVDNVEDIETKYPQPDGEWGVEVLSTHEKYAYDPITDTWHKTISLPEDKWRVDLVDGTKYVYDAESKAWKLLDAPVQDGWTINVKDTNYTYRYDEPTNTWIPISANAIPLATTELDGLLNKTDYAFIRSLGLESVFKDMGLIDENGNVVDVQGIVNASIIPTIYLKMSQMEEKMLPLGSVIPFMFNTNVPPAGFVFAEGQELLREEYPDLWEKISTEVDLEGNPLIIEDADRYDYPGKFTRGDGNATFRVPNLKGYFLRALDDSGREFGSRQGDSIAEHSHKLMVTGVGSINEEDEDLVQEGRLVLAGTTSNSFSDSTVLARYTSDELETRPQNIALRYLVKVIPSEKVPTIVSKGSLPDIHEAINADTLNGHASSLNAQAGYIPVANAQGKLDASWFNTDSLFEDIFVNDSEVSNVPDSNKIPRTTSTGKLDEWLSVVTEADVDKWIRYLAADPEDEANILDLSSFDDSRDSYKYVVTKKKFIKFLTGLKLFIGTYDHHYTTEDIEPTSERGYISNSERNKYSNKYTREETYQLIYNFLQSYVPLTDTSVVPSPNKIPIANEDGQLDSGWISDLFLNKIGEDNNTGYAEVSNHEITIKSGILNTSESGKVTIQGGGEYSLSEMSPAKAVISGYDNVEPKGGNVELYAGSGGSTSSSIGGSIILQSGSGQYSDGTVDLNNIKVNKNNTIYTNENNIRLQQNDGINNTNYLEINNNGITYVHDNLVNDSDDYRLTINKDGTVESNKPNVANSLTILNNKALVPFENLPKTSIVNNIGDFSSNQTISTYEGNVIVGNIAQNCNLTIADSTNNLEARELTFVLTATGPYNINWPVNIIWTSGRSPSIEYAETAIIKLFRIGNSEWIGWKVGDGSSSSSSSNILINEEEVPPTSFDGELHIFVESTEEIPIDEEDEPEEDPEISLSGLTINSDSSNITSTDSDLIILNDTRFNS